VKALWGVPEAFNKQNWPTLFARIKSEGFSGVECFRPLWRMPGFKAALDEAGLDLVA
jgi:sugar phosphate isomerase/epimerase